MMLPSVIRCIPYIPKVGSTVGLGSRVRATNAKTCLAQEFGESSIKSNHEQLAPSCQHPLLIGRLET